MKNRKRILALLVCAVFAFNLFGCARGTSPDPTTPPPATEPAPTEPPAREIFLEAVEPLLSKTALGMKVTIEETKTVAGSVFTSTTTQNISLQNIGSDAVQMTTYSTLAMDDYIFDWQEHYENGSAYGEITGFYYQTDMSQADFLSRYAPVLPLDEALYETVTAVPNGSATRFSFESPTAAESWALPEYAEMVSASGTANLSTDGQFSSFTYQLTYVLGPAEVEQNITIIPDYSNSNPLDFTIPEECTALEAFDAPVLLTKATLDIYLSPAITCTVTESLLSSAGALYIFYQESYDSFGTGSGYMANIKTDFLLQDFAGNTDSYSQIETYRDGSYTYSANGEEAEVSSALAPNIWEAFITSITSYFCSAEYLASATITELNGSYLLEFTGSEDLAQFQVKNIGYWMYDDENFIPDNSFSVSTSAMEGYLSIDKYTGLPMAFGTDYAGFHEVDGASYVLTDSCAVSIDLASTSAYETITGEAPAEDEPESRATPLFYHVTGTEGQEMWLMGTIHVGDNRTAYLPEEVYSALDASDALAVEFDTDAFTAATTTDADLAAQVAALYCYTDGTTTADHLDEELYEAAVQNLKATGNFNSTISVMKPAVYTQTIENAYLKQGYILSSEKGVDARLMDYARKNEIEIRDIESGLFQIEMLMGFSEELQIALLEEALEYDAMEYFDGVQELYELWCAGDEAVLREYLSTTVDTSEFTEEELAEYEAQKHLLDEYNKATSFARNDDMLKAAIDYLESGDVVFYAVGLAHLLDETNGLVDTLRDAGYAVELVEFAS